MNDTHLEDLLTLYALGLLEDDDRQQLGTYLSRIPETEADLGPDLSGDLACDLGQDLGRNLQIAREAATLLSYGTPPLDPSPRLKPTLWERIRADLPPASRLAAMRFTDLSWQPHPVSGVQIAVLHLDQDQREITALFHAAEGVQYPVHDHKGPEDIYMLRGDLQVGPITLQTGDFIRSDRGALHPHATQEGCLCLVRSCIDDSFLDIGSALESEAHFPFQLSTSRDQIWQPYATDGVEITLLCQDRPRGQITGVLRADPQVHYPLHQHGGMEEILMVSGDLIVEEQVFGPGDYLRSPKGSAHAPWTELGCRFLFRTSMRDRFLT